jgi:hypothetical protein
MATPRGAGIGTGDAGAGPLLDAASAGTSFMLDYL